MVLTRRSCTEDNLIARYRGIESSTLNSDAHEKDILVANAEPSPAENSNNDMSVSRVSYVSKHTTPVVTNFTGSSVGTSTKPLVVNKGSFSDKVAIYIEHVVHSNTVNSVPKGKNRAPGSISRADEHVFQGDSSFRENHLRSLKPPAEEKGYMSYDREFLHEAVFRGAMFLRNIQEVLKMGDTIYQSVYVRKHDLDEADIHAVDTFYTFMDSFLLRYFTGTFSTLEVHREHLLAYMERFHALRQRLRGTNGRDSFLIEALLVAMKRVRNVVIRIARFEALPGVVSMEDKDDENNIWEDCLAGKVAYYMLTNGFSPLAEERSLKFTCFLKMKKRPRSLDHLLKRVNDITKLANGMDKAKVEYLKMFAPISAA